MILNRYKRDKKEKRNEKKNKIKKKKKIRVEEEEEEEEENDKKEVEEKEEEEEEDEEKKPKYEKYHNERKKIINSNEDDEEIKKDNKKDIIIRILYVLSILLITVIIFFIIKIKRGKSNQNSILTNNSTLTNTSDITNANIITTNNNNINNNSPSQSSNKVNQQNDEASKLNRIKDELLKYYNEKEKLEIIRYYNEFIEKKEYNNLCTDKSCIQIGVGLMEKNINEVIANLASILNNAKQNHDIVIHIMLGDTFSYESFLKLKNVILKLDLKSEIIVYKAEQALKDFKIRDDKKSVFEKEYVKFYAFNKIKDVNKIIFLDIDDCMVQKDLSELFGYSVKDIYVRGLNEIPSIRHPDQWLEKYLPDKSNYINGGVMLVNLKLCRDEDFYKQAIELNNNEFYTKTEEPWQDILNVLMRKKIEFLHPKFNKINYYENQDDKSNKDKWYPWVNQTFVIADKMNHFYSKGDLTYADKDPFIIHYYWDKELKKNPKQYESDKNALLEKLSK